MVSEKLRVNFIQGPDYGADTAKYAGEAKESAERAYSYQLIALRSEETA
jgi:hypothetical protein